MPRAARAAAVLLLAAVLLPALAGACPLCKDAKSDADYAGGAASLPSGFYYSILLMVSAPFAVAGGLVWRIQAARRRLRSARNEAASPQPAAERSVTLVPDPPGARP